MGISRRGVLATAFTLATLTPLFAWALVAPTPHPIPPSTQSSGNRAASSATPTPCPTLTRNLIRGMDDDQVLVLQQFLKTQGYLPASTVLDRHFGPSTERAVQALQKAKNLVSSGTPATTGFGAVRLQTRTTIAALCRTAGSSKPAKSFTELKQHIIAKLANPACPQVPLPTGTCTKKWIEVKDANKCTASWQCAAK